MSKKLLSVTLAILALASCATSPLGRKQLITVSDDQMNGMGVQAFDEMKRTKAIETDPRKLAYVKCIAQNIVQDAKDKVDPADWEVIVFRDKAVNAFALPGAKIGVYTGIIPVASNQHQLAAVMGHEVGHVLARHGSERVSEAGAANLVMTGLNAAKGSNKSSQLLNVLGVTAGAGLQVGLLAFSRTHESEADIMGLYSMARVGFDPRESVTLWKNMAKASGSKGIVEFLSTHPSNETRIQQLEEHMPEAMKLFDAARSSSKNPACDTI
ncbi:MAG: M48 family metallopeptidase [Xanthomonadaceae bacterium]|nr:M48 family metallopeptidase [Xanthomonadaceae bacterium]